MKTLYVVRHAKSSWDNQFMSDHDRPLNERGYQNAPQIGAFVATKTPPPDLIVSSTANRAATTARLIAEQWGYPSDDIQATRLLYWFDYDLTSIIKLLQSMDNKLQSILLAGHNPTFTHLANHFLQHHHFNELPTCAFICLSFPIDSWEDIDSVAAQLEWHIFPKMLLK